MKWDFKKLKEIRIRLGKPSQENVAKALGYKAPSNYTKKELGHVPTYIKDLEKLSSFYGVDLSEFFIFDGSEPLEQTRVPDKELANLLYRLALKHPYKIEKLKGIIEGWLDEDIAFDDIKKTIP